MTEETAIIDNLGQEGPERTFLGHPRGLFVLFMAEMWERFCYYGMRVLLTLYLIEELLIGNTESFAIYGAYTALVYAAPVLGGRIADRLLGYRLAVILGGVLMAIGEFLILGGTESWLYVGMGTIIVGNGYFKANISSIVGRLYRDDDPKKDSGFTIFYIGINIGALLATTLVAEVGNIYGYKWGFALAGIGMIAGLLFFLGGQKEIRHHAEPPRPEKLKEKAFGPVNWFQATVVGSLMIIPILYLLIDHNAVVGYLLGAVAIYVLYSLLSTAFSSDKVQRDRILILIILMLFNVVFWAFFEQAGTSLTVFAKDNVDRMIGGWEMGAATTQFFNPFFILILGSIFSWMWVRLDKAGMNPNIPTKFGLGLVFLGLGYLMVKVGGGFSEAGLVPLWTLTFLYLLHTTGELFISPIGLSMVTKLVPKTMTGTVMGAWFLTFAGANFLAGQIAQLTGEVETGAEGVPNPEESLSIYTEVFSNIGFASVGTGLFLILAAVWLKRLLHGVK
ncbi:MAG: oligopeptide:H+ symporter [Bacteroidota bacterium]|nr:oligopeptide:H+ symporter [Bacteroidota bacterium]